jgi:hypothetical protein
MEDCVRRLSWLAIPVLAGLAWGCGDSTGVTEADLVGTWNATAFKFSDFGDPVMDFDVIGMGGSAQIVINANGTYTVTITIPNVGPDVATGTWVLQGSDILILTQTGDRDDGESVGDDAHGTQHRPDLRLRKRGDSGPAQRDVREGLSGRRPTA